MPVQIGAQAHNFSDPTGLLSDCHRRIEMFLRVLEGVASVIDRPMTEETPAALESALRYFREAGPKHTADEEESLFPRLRQMRLPEAETAIERLAPLEHDHRGRIFARRGARVGTAIPRSGKFGIHRCRSVPKSNCQSCLHIQAAHQCRGRLSISSGSATLVLC